MGFSRPRRSLGGGGGGHTGKWARKEDRVCVDRGFEELRGRASRCRGRSMGAAGRRVGGG